MTTQWTDPTMTADATTPSTLPPEWALTLPKPACQHVYDLIGAPLRMVVLPDAWSERLHLTSLRAERLARVLPALRGKCLDIGAGDNTLVHLYTRQRDDADGSLGVDVVDWGGGCQLIESSDALPFDDASFDTVAFIACLNHIPERKSALVEAQRVLGPDGRIVITMIGRTIGAVGHALWWYSEDKHRDVDEHEEPGLDHRDVLALLDEAGLSLERHERFGYGLNHLYVATPRRR